MAKKAKTKRKTPMRMCVGCRERFDKRDLVRVVRTPEQEVRVDLTGKLSGRGAYVCHNRQCLDRAIKSKALQRALEVEIAPDIVTTLLDDIQ